MSDWSDYTIVENSNNPFEFIENSGLSAVVENVRSVFSRSSDVRARREQGDRKKTRNIVNNNENLFMAPSTNRRPAKYQFEAVLGGFDGGIEVGWFGDYEPRMDDTFRVFDDVKERLRAGDDMAGFVSFGGCAVKLLPMGARVGYLTYSYQFEFHGVTVLLHKSPNADVQAVRVKIGAVALLRSSLQEIYSVLIKMFNDAGINLFRECVSRADLQIMTSDYTVNQFLESMQGNRIVTKCRGKCAIYSDIKSGNVESITFKSSTCELCIYDKLAELSCKDESYYKWFCAQFVELPAVLTRVEIRLRREALRRWRVNTVNDLIHAAQALVSFYTSDWFRILSRAKVRGSECEISPCKLWQHVQELFRSVFAVDSPRPLLRRLPACENKVKKLVAIASGCVAKACALLQRSKDSVKGISDAVFDLFYPLFKEIDDKRAIAALELSADGYYLED